MAMKHLCILVLAFLLCTPSHAFAFDKEAGSSGTFSEFVHDRRVEQLSNYLDAVNSPMAPDAIHFIREADRLNLDWKLIAAISGVESYFGRHIPRNSYNAWGWAIFTGRQSGRSFDTWKDGITVVSEGLKEKYVNRGRETVEKMGSVYAADPAWARKVRFFMNQIETYKPDSTRELAIAL